MQSRFRSGKSLQKVEANLETIR